VLILANHPNALIDPLLVGTAIDRRVVLTAKATLFEHPGLAWLLQAMGVVPLRRAKDEAHDRTAPLVTPQRNAQAFALVTSALRASKAVLIFPEGISHDDPSLAPLKSGAARMALQANREGVAGLRLLPMGLVFEQKERPDSRVLVRVGDAIDLDAWLAEHRGANVRELTDTLEVRLRAVTLNFATAERAARAVRLARVLVALAGSPAPLHEPRSLDTEAAIALRIDTATSALADAPPEIIEAADTLVARLDTIERDLRRYGIDLADVRVSTRWPDAMTFIAREGPLALVAGIAVVFGWAMHWIPLRAARALALQSLTRNPSRDQPAMRTILFGLSAIAFWYVVQFIVLARITNPFLAFGWLALIFSAAHALRLRGGRLRRALQRARSFLAFRADPSLQPRLVAAVDQALDESLTLEGVLTGTRGTAAGELRG
jgi:1-acyl-sn-glycerol-3-phosphate acyltransferase